MTVRRENARERILTLVAVLAVPLILAGCTPTPEPYFGWGTQGVAHKTAMVKPKARPTPTYSEAQYTEDRYYDRRADRWQDRANSDSSTPAARQRQKWYDQPAERDDGDAHPNYNNRPATDYTYGSNVRFSWPVRGRVVADFGSSPGGERNNGINIAAPDRAPIRAAADGTVSYTGNELRNYGNLALIKHEGGYVTAYAHADEFIVGKGDRVARGQVIGYVGTTGDVRSPQLHFELRRGSHGETPIDPRQYLGSQQLAAR